MEAIILMIRLKRRKIDFAGESVSPENIKSSIEIQSNQK